ncbi:hypothetical protein PMAC_002747 [Pneumocystis sp. 'macacae']|nr:hypothetical protein PMAC_002747 [Pneumocystis sp. 'macacae']
MNEFKTIYTATCPDDDTYVYDLAFKDDILVSSGSDGALRLWDPETLKMSSIALQAHKDISDIKISEKHMILSCGSDGIVKFWDTRTLGTCMEFKTEKKVALLSVSENSNKTKISSGSILFEQEASIFLWDKRKLSLLFSYTESHNDDVRFHPDKQDILCSGGCDGLINIFDTKILDEDEAIIQVLNHQSSIHRADFIGLNTIFGLSHMETFSLYNIQDIEKDTVNNENTTAVYNYVSLGDIRSKFKCNYVIDVISRNTNDTAYLCCGTHNEKTSLWLIHCDGTIDQQVHIRLDNHNDALTRCLVFDEEKQVIYTGGEDGQIRGHRLVNDENKVPPIKKIKTCS